MQRLICPNCGYAKESFPGNLIVVVEANVTVSLNRTGKPKAGISRRVNMKKNKLGNDPVVTCPNCGEEFKVLDIVRFGCSQCGKEIAPDRVSEFFCKAALDLRCPAHMDTYYCDTCSFSGECKLLEQIRSR